MKGISFFFLAVSLALLVACKKQEDPKPIEPPKAEATNGTDDANPAAAKSTGAGSIIAAPAEYVGALGRAQQSADKSIDLAGYKQAITMFQAQEGRYPKTLNELVTSGTMRKLPEPPHGMEVQYDPATGNVRIVKK